MPGPPPKSPEQRRRTNKPRSGEWVVLPDSNPEPPPPLPTLKGVRWTKATKDWWELIWRSPMSTQWLEVDRHVLGDLAMLRQEMFQATRLEDRLKLDAIIQKISDKFGLSPKGRRDLRWVVTDEDRVTAGIRPALSLVRRIPAK